MDPTDMEDDDVPFLGVEGLNEATRQARKVGDIVIVRDGQLIKLAPDSSFEVICEVPRRVKSTVRFKRIKP